MDQTHAQGSHNYSKATVKTYPLKTL